MKLTIDTDEIRALAREGDKFIFKKEAEKGILELLEVQKQVNEAVETLKMAIAEAGCKIDPSFSGVRGEKVNAVFRFYGEKYEYDWTKKEELKPFLNEKTYFKVDSDKVDGYLEQVGELPDGIKLKDRSKKLSLSISEGEIYGLEGKRS